MTWRSNSGCAGQYIKKQKQHFRQDVAPTGAKNAPISQCHFVYTLPVAMVTRSLQTGISKALVQVFWTCCWNDNKSILILFIKRKRSKLRNKCCQGSGAKSSNSGTGPRTINTKMEHRTLAWVLVINERAWFHSVHIDSRPQALTSTGDRRLGDRFVPLWMFAISRFKTRKFRRRGLFSFFLHFSMDCEIYSTRQMCSESKEEFEEKPSNWQS